MSKVGGLLLVGVGLGACCVFVYQQLWSPDGDGPAAGLVGHDPAPGGATRTEGPGAADLVAGPRRRLGPLGHLGPPAPLVSTPSVVESPGRGGDGGGEGIVSAMALERAISLGNAAYANKDYRQAKRYLQSAFHHGKESEQFDLTLAAKRLLVLDDDPQGRGEYLRYLGSRGLGREAFDELLGRARSLASADEPASVRRAWVELSVAYDASLDAGQRRRVLDVLEPYIDRLVFAGRFTPLVVEHAVEPGDKLWTIATRFGTTVDALKRLNRLNSDRIQPRMRLRILPGEVTMFVDKSEFRLWVKVDDRVFLERPIGLGQDNRTPAGRFVVRVKQKDPIWYAAGERPIPAGDPRNVLGSRWLGFENTKQATGIGIHATDDLADIGRESSGGCIRVHAPDMELIYDFIPRGTVVTIRE